MVLDPPGYFVAVTSVMVLGMKSPAAYPLVVGDVRTVRLGVPVVGAVFQVPHPLRRQ